MYPVRGRTLYQHVYLAEARSTQVRGLYLLVLYPLLFEPLPNTNTNNTHIETTTEVHEQTAPTLYYTNK